MISRLKKVFLVVFGLILSILLAIVIHIDPSHPWFDPVFVIPPTLGGLMTGWLNQKYDRSILIVSLLLFLPLLILGTVFGGISDNPNAVNDAFTRLVVWFIFIQIGGKLGSMLYQKLSLKR